MRLRPASGPGPNHPAARAAARLERAPRPQARELLQAEPVAVVAAGLGLLALGLAMVLDERQRQLQLRCRVLEVTMGRELADLVAHNDQAEVEQSEQSPPSTGT